MVQGCYKGGLGFIFGEAKEASKVVTGTMLILGFEASVLFYSSAVHSFVSSKFVRLSWHVVRTL